MSDVKPRLLTPADAARYMGVSPSYLANSRSGGNPNAPAYVKDGRIVRYDVHDLDAWIESRKRQPTGAAVE